MLSALANPRRFMAVSAIAVPLAGGLAAALFAVGIPWSWLAPEDFRQGEAARIMYVHVPASWTALAAYAGMALAGLSYLIWRHALADAAGKALAEAGLVFTLLSIITGAAWGKSEWGAWWVWDARLTSVAVMALLYTGVLALRASMESRRRAADAAAILAVLGAVNLPIVKFSVDWWATLHQGTSVLRLDGPTIHPDLLWPLVVMGLGYLSLLTCLTLLSMRSAVFTARTARRGRI